MKKCCCYYSVRAGTITIGVFRVLISVMALVAVIAFCVGRYEDIKKMRTEWIALVIVCAIVAPVQLILDVFLTLGAILERPKLIAPWIWAAAFFGIVGGVSGVVGTIMLLLSGGAGAVKYFLGHVFATAIYIHFFLVVNSYHSELVSSYLEKSTEEASPYTAHAESTSPIKNDVESFQHSV